LRLPPPDPSARARLSVDRVFTVRGSGTVVTGTLVEGRLAVGAPISVVGSEGAQTSSVRGLHVHDHQVQSADAPTRLAINLAGLALESVHRGDVVTDDTSVVATGLIDVVLRSGAIIKPGTVASLHVGTARTSARIDPIGGSAGKTRAPDDGHELAAEPSPLVRLRLGRPLVAVGGDRFVLRGSDVEGPAGAVIGGGLVLDARPPRARPRAKRRAVLEALATGDTTSAARALVVETAPRPLARGVLASRFVVRPAALAKAADALSDRGELARFKSSGWLLRSSLVALAAQARKLVSEHHAQAPLDRGLPLETLRQRLADVSGPDAAEEAIRLSADARAAGVAGEPILVEADVVRLASFAAGTAAQDVAGVVGIAARALVDAALKGMSEFGVKEATAASPKDTRAILAKLVRDGVAVRAGDLWFSRASVDDLKARVVDHLRRSARLTIAEFKTLSGLGRKQAIVLLELYDREGVTKRDGDDRISAGAR
jgi:selenocysteine-specific elongation factor